MNVKNKNHWYDGYFYDLLIAPNQDSAFAHVRNLIAPGSTLLDVGCGTGRLALQLIDKCSRIEGIDPSVRNINIAQRKLAEKPTDKIRFHHVDALEFLTKKNVCLDYATISYVIHEIEEQERNQLLQKLALVARTIIIVDYLVPQPRNYWRILNEAVEFAAGSSHYRNFKSFVAGNGLAGLLERTGLMVLSELKNDPPSSHIVLTTRKAG